MVLQRDQTNTFWGWTEPGKKVNVMFGDTTASTVSGKDGKWLVKIKPPKAGGPYEVKISGPTEKTLKNILVGDVWICSGQSNMEMGITLVKNSKQEIERASEFPNIRICLVPRSTPLVPAEVTNAPWRVCSAQTVVDGGWGGFSALGLLFAMDLYDVTAVPIGLVQSSWGGTVAEAWVSKGGLRKSNNFAKELELIEELSAPNQPPLSKKVQDWFESVDPLSKAKWQESSAGNSVRDVPFSLASRPASGTGDIYWMQREFDLPSPLPVGYPLLTLGSNQDVLTAWVNDVQVAETYAGQMYGQVPLPLNALKPGKNKISMRLLTYKDAGGFLLNGDHLNLRIGGHYVPLGGSYSIPGSNPTNVSIQGLPPMIEGNPNTPTVLYNGMISPLTPLAVKGTLWYQGESNVGRSEQYKSILSNLIADWRSAFDNPRMPFMIVQLANFGKRSPVPSPNNVWAELRDAQAFVAKQVPNTALVSAIDVGDANDIHPLDKQSIARRLAFLAVSKFYKGGEVFDMESPTLKSVSRRGNSLEVSFTTSANLHLTGTLNQSFAISENGVDYHWVTPTLKNNRVTLQSDLVKSPAHVIYGWDEDPALCLFTTNGLPVLPFKTSLKN